MLSETAAAHLRALTFRHNAERTACLLPYTGIYWEDELPELRQMMTLSEQEQIQVFRLLGMRVRE